MISWPGRWDGWRERSRGEATRAASAGKVHVEKHDYGDYGAKSNFSARKICRVQKKDPLHVEHCLRVCLQAGTSDYTRGETYLLPLVEGRSTGKVVSDHTLPIP